MTKSEQAAEVARRLAVVSHPDLTLIAEAVALFAPMGWAMCGNWHKDGTVDIVTIASQGADQDSLDEAITDLWNTKNRVFLQHAAAPIRRWSNSHPPFKQILWGRVALIEKAIEHHFAGAYEASIPIILAQIDGLSRDLTEQSFFSKANSDPYLDDETLAGMQENLPVVRRVFSQDVKESGTFGYASRHGVLPGRDLGYATRENSTKTIVLVAALAEYFPRVADDAGARLRRAHENSVVGSRVLDDKGRLIDDRHIPEVLHYAYDLDSEYLNSVLLNPGPFDLQETLTQVARKHGLDPAAITVGQDDIGWWWYYTVPADQTLGYAARPSTSAKRRHPDVWRWDALHTPGAPAQPPWKAAEGWRSDDVFPRSPNWEPHLII